MNSTATLNRIAIERLRLERTDFETDLAMCADPATQAVLHELIADVDRGIAWHQREIDAEGAAA